MDHKSIIAEIDAEIASLEQAKEVLLSGHGVMGITKRAAVNATKPAAKKRTMSAASRKRIAEAQRKRWAAQKKAAGL